MRPVHDVQHSPASVQTSHCALMQENSAIVLDVAIESSVHAVLEPPPRGNLITARPENCRKPPIGSILQEDHLGRPASRASSASIMAAPGSFSEGLRTKVLPTVQAMGNIQSGIMAGKLKGQMPATTCSAHARFSYPCMQGALHRERVKHLE